jgi:hypothetical protein
VTAEDRADYLGPCDVDDCSEVAWWSQTREDGATRVNCPQHPHQPLMAALHTYLRRIG